MQTFFKEYDEVKIIRLLENNRAFTGIETVSRSPQVGGIGTIAGLDNSTKAYIVEMVNSQGYTIWLANFIPDELEPA
jgi:hypothetical protein